MVKKRTRQINVRMRPNMVADLERLERRNAEVFGREATRATLIHAAIAVYEKILASYAGSSDAAVVLDRGPLLALIDKVAEDTAMRMAAAILSDIANKVPLDAEALLAKHGHPDLAKVNVTLSALNKAGVDASAFNPRTTNQPETNKEALSA